jgi:hypothetical protein
MKTNTLKRVLMTSVLVASATVASVAAHAESFTMTVPFAFSAGGKTLPAGSYAVDASSMVLTLRGEGGSAILLAVPSMTSLSGKSGADFDERMELAALASVKLSSGMTYTVPALKKIGLTVVSPPEGAVLSKRP